MPCIVFKKNRCMYRVLRCVSSLFEFAPVVRVFVFPIFLFPRLCFCYFLLVLFFFFFTMVLSGVHRHLM